MEVYDEQEKASCSVLPCEMFKCMKQVTKSGKRDGERKGKEEGEDDDCEEKYHCSVMSV